MGVLSKPIPFGDYFLLEKVNTGGMAEVFKAKTFGAEGFERIVAVKKILPSIAEDKEFITMFINEAKLAAQLTHANIVQTNDLGCINGDYYIAMEYVPGHDLRVIFERCVRMNRKLDIACVCFIISKICEGLDYAHNKKDANGVPMNIIHRDISPQNILISYDGECKLIDFGIAKATNQSNATQVGILKGKFSYMSPEQVSGKTNIDRRSDIFALGIVLFEMLTLKRLFLGASDFETLEKIRKVEVSPPTLYNSAIPEELEDIVLKALEKDVTQRYQTAQEMQEALQRFMFKNNLYYTAKDLSEFCRSMFAQEIALEQKKMEFYKELTLDVLMQSKKTEAQEDETAFYARQNVPRMSGIQYESVSSEPAPKQAIYEELDHFEPPTGDDIVYSSKNGGHANAAHNKPEDVKSLILAPVANGHNVPVPRKSVVTTDVVSGSPASNRSVLTNETVVRKRSGRTVYVTIAFVLVTIIVGLCLWALMRPKTPQNYAQNPIPEQSVARTANVQKEQSRDATLSIYVNHDMVDLKVDGRSIPGNRSFKVRNLAPGEHFVVVAKDGYKTYEHKIRIEEGGELSLTPELKPKFATLILKTEPGRAHYELRNRRTGLSKNGMTEVGGISIADLPADDSYDITIYDGDNPQKAVWTPNVQKANEAETRSFTLRSGESPVVVAAAQEDEPSPVAEPSKPHRHTASRPKKRSDDDDLKITVKKKTAPAPEPAPAPAPAAAAPQPDVPGMFMINSKPASDIYINGKKYGSLSVKTAPMKPGTYTIRFVNKEANVDMSKKIVLEPGKTKLVRFVSDKIIEKNK